MKYKHDIILALEKSNKKEIYLKGHNQIQKDWKYL